MTKKGEGHVPGCCSGGKVFLFWSQSRGTLTLFAVYLFVSFRICGIIDGSVLSE